MESRELPRRWSRKLTGSARGQRARELRLRATVAQYAGRASERAADGEQDWA